MTLACRSTAFLALLAGAAASSLAVEPIPSNYELLETISIPSDGSIATSKTILTEGVTYRLLAYGTDPGAGDAEYDWAGQDRCGPELTPTDVGIGVSTGIPVSPASFVYDKRTFWGPFDPGHAYTVVVTGRGARLSVGYSDCTYEDNLGGLTLWIFGPKAYLRPGCEVVFTQPTFVEGEVVTPRLIRLRNSDTKPVAVEFKLWLRMPVFGPVALVNVGADSKYQLPANYDREFDYVRLFTVTPDFPRGTYEVACTLSDPATGEVLDRSVDRFGIR